MEIAIKNGKETLALRIDGYEFEKDKVDDDYDRNFLNIAVRYRNGDDVRECVDPCLLTWETGHIIDALEDVLEGRSEGFDQDDLWIVESNLEFQVRAEKDGRFLVSAHFGAGGKFGEDLPSAGVSEVMDAAQLRRVLAMLRIGNGLFPLR